MAVEQMAQDGSMPCDDIIEYLVTTFRRNESTHDLIHHLMRAQRKPGQAWEMYRLFLEGFAMRIDHRAARAEVRNKARCDVWEALIRECPEKLRAELDTDYGATQILAASAHVKADALKFPMASPFSLQSLANERYHNITYRQVMARGQRTWPLPTVNVRPHTRDNGNKNRRPTCWQLKPQ